jgi:hypothetical protein
VDRLRIEVRIYYADQNGEEVPIADLWCGRNRAQDFAWIRLEAEPNRDPAGAGATGVTVSDCVEYPLARRSEGTSRTIHGRAAQTGAARPSSPKSPGYFEPEIVIS